VNEEALKAACMLNILRAKIVQRAIHRYEIHPIVATDNTLPSPDSSPLIELESTTLSIIR